MGVLLRERVIETNRTLGMPRVLRRRPTDRSLLKSDHAFWRARKEFAWRQPSHLTTSDRQPSLHVDGLSSTSLLSKIQRMPRNARNEREDDDHKDPNVEKRGVSIVVTSLDRWTSFMMPTCRVKSNRYLSFCMESYRRQAESILAREPLEWMPNRSGPERTPPRLPAVKLERLTTLSPRLSAFLSYRSRF